ncbi:hypothetical protein AAC387_Pa01g3477 [Persea americana]
MQQGGSPYGVSPEMETYAGGTGSRAHMLDQLLLQQQQQKSGDAAAALAEAASPISSRPPAGANFDELPPCGSGFPDEEALAGEDAERGGTSGNRWPRQETLALLKIRSEMATAFKEATLKGPLWEDVSRRLAELGYSRSGKKCKEKFENLQKYYKRTKEGRAGRQDGKCYRFFSQLEALHSGSGGANPTFATTVTATSVIPTSVAMASNNPIVGSSSGTIQSHPISAHVAVTPQRPNLAPTMAPAGVSGTAGAGVSFSSNTSSSTGSEEDEMEEGFNMEARKRKRTELGGGGSSKKMMAFFERLMKEVVEKQEKMLQRFIETMEKREQDRMIREEAWRRQEMGRLTLEQEMMAQERAISASRDAALIAFLQKFTGQTIQIVTIPAAAPPPQQTPRPPQTNPTPPQPPPQPQQQQQQQQHQQYQNQSQITEAAQHQPQSSELVLVQQEQPEMTSGSYDPTSSRWPKAEVLALINLRSSLDLKYQESGPKGPLWEEISSGMQQLGYKRSSKRCKEKWENINKYFKKVKESKKQRPEDAKTCPYFHQLDALYRRKLFSSGGTGAQNKQEQQMSLDSGSNEQESGDVLAILPPPLPQTTAEIKNNSSNTNQIGGSTEVGATLPIQTSNGGLPPSFFAEGTVKKPEDILKELMAGSNHHQQQQAAMNDDYDKIVDSDGLDEDDDDDEDEEDGEESEEDKKMAYKIQYQKPSAGPSSGQENQSNSFLGMVQ